LTAVHTQRPVGGLTHNSYRYPARFSPQFARATIEAFSRPGDTILDPFMGGATSLVEGRALGRHSVGSGVLRRRARRPRSPESLGVRPKSARAGWGAAGSRRAPTPIDESARCKLRPSRRKLLWQPRHNLDRLHADADHLADEANDVFFVVGPVGVGGERGSGGAIRRGPWGSWRPCRPARAAGRERRWSPSAPVPCGEGRDQPVGQAAGHRSRLEPQRLATLRHVSVGEGQPRRSVLRAAV
jgi:hypothetical protein